MAINSIRLSLAQSTVSKLLPLPKILEVLSVLHDFLLLRRGEFATALVSHADHRLQERRRKPEALGPRDKSARVLRGLAVKEGDVTAALAQTWAELYSLQNEEDPQDDELDLGRDLLRLSVNGSKESQQSVEDGVDLGQATNISNIVFEDLLFPTPTSLSVQGEVINGSWQHFRDWIEGRPTSVGSSVGSRPQTAASSKTQESGFEGFGQIATQRHDPETLTIAHRGYLFSVVQSLFLTDVPFTKALRSLLTSVDHFIALVVRLEGIQRNMDLETDEGVVDALVDYAGEEREVWQSLSAARHQVEVGIKNVVARLRDIDDNRSGERRKMFNAGRPQPGHWSAPPQSGTSAESAIDHYVPRKAAGVDRLLMKLDFGNANGSVGPTAAVAGFI
ncbi:hypothetical protein N8T08_007342 [Aspergillus melleus]|uniref:Uncharacterized protein n=1 Tax=Aspergillus melleus TaxID=138277 RepID=A0ACC3AXW1_9EURO|nr:hypothetical protein N8T08_007342 [Aspergillus melleus]